MREPPTIECATPPPLAVGTADTVPLDRAADAVGDLAAGTLVDRYEIEGRLGSGSMGVVYVARDSRLGRRVAIKLLRARPDSPLFRELCQRLIREARAMASVSHPNLVAIHDIGTFAGRDYIVMDYVDGCTLRDWVTQERRPWTDRFDVLTAAGRGLAEAHAAGVIHRDFKPDNVLVSRRGRVQVTDFGLARGIAGLPAIPRTVDAASPFAMSMPVIEPITRLGVALGTPLYMAPELHLGQVADARSDQFAFSVAAWEVLYDRHPFVGRTVLELARAVQLGDILDPPDPISAPRCLVPALRRGLMAEREARWPSMDDLLATLEQEAARVRRRWLGALVGRGAIRRVD
jgi:eukaryotic-like serine/threonine-protein kinase